MLKKCLQGLSVSLFMLLLVACNHVDSKKNGKNSEENQKKLQGSEDNIKASATVLKHSDFEQEVEIAPKKWLRIYRKIVHEAEKPDWSTHSQPKPTSVDNEWEQIDVKWNSVEVVWKGAPVPICLREWEGGLYIIGLDRSVLERSIFRYYRLNGQSFKEVSPSEFPKSIATQNMWFKTDKQAKRDLELTRSLNVQDKWFSDTLTAQIWIHLYRGKDFFQSKNNEEIDAIKEYKEKFNPIVLPSIIRE